MFTLEQVIEILEDYASHYEAHVHQYCDPQDIMTPEEFIQDYIGYYVTNREHAERDSKATEDENRS